MCEFIQKRKKKKKFKIKKKKNLNSQDSPEIYTKAQSFFQK